MADRGLDLVGALANRWPEADRDLALLLVATARLGWLIERDIERISRPGGLEQSEHWVLISLWLAREQGQTLSPIQLSEIILQTRSGMTKTLRRLDSARLIERIPDSTDGRKILVHLTPAGAKLVERHTQEMFDRWKTRLRAYDGSKRQKLAQMLWKLLQIVESTSAD